MTLGGTRDRAVAAQGAGARRSPQKWRARCTATAWSAALGFVTQNGEVVGRVVIQYARPAAGTEATVSRVELVLLLGVLLGSGFALLAGMAIARRAMAPIADADQHRRGDRAHARPLAQGARAAGRRRGGRAGAHARGHAPRARRRARRDRGDARAPAPLRGRRLARAAHAADERARQPRAAGRVAARRRRARRRARRCAPRSACAGWWPTCCCWRAPTPRACSRASRATSRRSSSRPPPSSARSAASTRSCSTSSRAIVEGARDELHRLAINLIENALRHTPPGTEIRVQHAQRPPTDWSSSWSKTTVRACPPELAPTLFERFVRGAGDRGGSFGLGLAIVHAVADSHGGTVDARAARARARGARASSCACRRYSDLDDDRQHHRAALEAVVD